MYRKKFLTECLQLTPSQVWETVASRAVSMGFDEADLIFGIWQEKKGTTGQLIVKNAKGEVIGHIEYVLGSREYKISLGEESYLIEWLATGAGRRAILKKCDGAALATFERDPWAFFRHQFIFSNSKTLVSHRPHFNLKIPFDYWMKGKLIGTSQAISSTRNIGQIVLLTSDFSELQKIFIIAIRAGGI